MTTLSRRTFIVGSAVLTGLGVTGTAALPHAHAAAGLTDLGPAIKSVNVRAAGFGHLPDGTAIAFALSNGYPVSFTVLELTTGRQLFAAEIPDATVGSWAIQGPNGDLWFAVRHPVAATIYRFDVADRTLHRIAERVGGETVLYSAKFDSSGVLWFGTYPHAKLMSYDPATGEFTDYGSQTDDAAYVFSVGIVEDKIWVGTGPVPHLFVLDPTDGTRTELHPPDHIMANTSWFIGIDQRGDDVLVRLSPRGTYDSAFYHLRSQTWSTDIISGVGGAMPTAVTRSGDTYVLVQNSSLVGYSTRRDAIFDTRFDRTDLPARIATTVNSYGMDVVGVPELGLPGETVAGMTTDGDLWFYNLATARTRMFRAEILPTSAEAHGIGTGPDGQVYVGAYLSSGVMSRIDPDTLEITGLRGPKQGDAMIEHDGELVVSSYPGAVVHSGDVTQQWEWGTNPRQVLEIGRGEPHFQDRAFGLASAGSLLAIGTIGDYGRLDGALTLLDIATGESTVHRGVVAEQSVISLAYRDGLIYGTTSIHGGLSSTPTAAEAKLFVWDVAAEAVVWEGTLSPGAQNAGGLLWGPDGGLVGTTSNGDLFTFDPATRTVTGLVPVVAKLPGSRGWGYSAKTVYDAATDSYVGTQSGKLFQLRRGADSATVLSEDMEQITQAGNGRIIGVDDTHAYLISPA
jgi:streptogramin lyase